MNTLETIKTRRSTRKFKNEPVEKALLEKVIEAGRYAPSGGNSQSTHFIVITNKEILSTLQDKVKTAFAAMELEPGMYKSKVNSIKASKSGMYIYDYNAPALIVTANQKDYGNNIADCACALENMMLAANELNLGSCWINQLRWLNEDETILEAMYELGMDESERVYGALAIGYPDSEDGLPIRTPLLRTGNRVTWIEDLKATCLWDNPKIINQFEFRSIHPDEVEQAINIEQICFPPNEACSPKAMTERIAAAPELFMVAVDKNTGKIAGFLNGLSTSEEQFRDEFFTDVSLYEPSGKHVMLLGLDVLPEYRMQGLAREIVNQYCKREKANNREKLHLTCLDGKVEMYLKFGFEDRGIANSTWGGEEWHEMVTRL